MTNERIQALRTGRNIGAVIGGLVFLVFGVAPAFYFGSAGTLMLLTHLMGGPVDPGILVRGMLVIGTLLGLICVASVSIVVGSVLGTALGFVTDAVADAFRASEPEKAAVAARK